MESVALFGLAATWRQSAAAAAATRIEGRSGKAHTAIGATTNLPEEEVGVFNFLCAL
jgi:hypothetical protein